MPQLDVEVDMEDKEAKVTPRSIGGARPQVERDAHTKITTVETHGRL